MAIFQGERAAAADGKLSIPSTLDARPGRVRKRDCSCKSTLRAAERVAMTHNR